MDARLEEQQGRTALYIYNELRDLQRKQNNILHRRMVEESMRHRDFGAGYYRSARSLVKSRVVKMPWTHWTPAQAMQVLYGDFDRAVKLIKRLKKIQTDTQHKSMRFEDRPSNLGNLLRQHVLGPRWGQ